MDLKFCLKNKTLLTENSHQPPDNEPRIFWEFIEKCEIKKMISFVKNSFTAVVMNLWILLASIIQLIIQLFQISAGCWFEIEFFRLPPWILTWHVKSLRLKNNFLK